jgi:hypothetical protein
MREAVLLPPKVMALWSGHADDQLARGKLADQALT